MTISATIVVGPGFESAEAVVDALVLSEPRESISGKPMVCADLLGRSPLDCVIQKLLQTGVKSITLVIEEKFSRLLRAKTANAVRLDLVPDASYLWSAAEGAVRELVGHGAEMVLLYRLGAYVEIDFANLARTHRDAKHQVTAVNTDEGPVDLWVLSSRHLAKNPTIALSDMLAASASNTSYSFSGYINRLSSVHDARALVSDSLNGRCEYVPAGRQIEKGVWLHDDARVHHGAKLSAPAYVGSGVTVRARALIGPHSSIERGCEIAEGTIVDNASVLANTYLGRGLHVSESVVDGGRLLALRHGTVVEIDDGYLLGRTAAEVSHSVTTPSRNTSLAERLLEFRFAPNFRQA